MQHLLDQLQSVGLSEREAKVYLANLSRGPSTVQALAEHASISRSSVYSVIDALMAMGLVASVEHDARKLFRAEQPDRVVELLRRRTSDLASKIEHFESNLTSFAAVARSEQKRPRARVFEGVEGVREMFEHVSVIESSYIEYLPAVLMHAVFDRDGWASWRDRWVKARSCGRVLIFSETTVPQQLRTFLRHGCQVRHTTQAPLYGHVHVRGGTVCEITQADVPVGFLIQHEPLAHCLRVCFEHLWEHAEKLHE